MLFFQNFTRKYLMNIKCNWICTLGNVIYLIADRLLSPDMPVENVHCSWYRSLWSRDDRGLRKVIRTSEELSLSILALIYNFLRNINFATDVGHYWTCCQRCHLESACMNRNFQWLLMIHFGPGPGVNGYYLPCQRI